MYLVIPDLHIGATWNGYSRNDEIFGFLENNLIPFTKSKGVEISHIVWLGDIFHNSNVSHHMITDFIKVLNRITTGTICGHFILRGNHDGEIKSKSGSPLQEVEASGVAHIAWEPEIIANVGALLPYCTPEVLSAVCDKAFINRCTGLVGFTHLNIPAALPGIEAEFNHGITPNLPDWVEKTCRIIYAGHIHKIQVIPPIRIVGSVLQMSKDDAGPKIYMGASGDASNTEDVYPIQSWPILDLSFNLGVPSDVQKFHDLYGSGTLPHEALLSVSLNGSGEQLANPSIRETLERIKTKVKHVRECIIVDRPSIIRNSEIIKYTNNVEIFKNYVKGVEILPETVELGVRIIGETV